MTNELVPYEKPARFSPSELLIMDAATRRGDWFTVDRIFWKSCMRQWNLPSHLVEDEDTNYSSMRHYS